jgi:hypothetical protein
MYYSWVNNILGVISSSILVESSVRPFVES